MAEPDRCSGINASSTCAPSRLNIAFLRARGWMRILVQPVYFFELPGKIGHCQVAKDREQMTMSARKSPWSASCGCVPKIAGAFLFETPREWACFGVLFLEDGVVGGKRILPEGWVRYSTTPTPNALVRYGAGWWINQGDSRGARFRREYGMPANAFMSV